MIYIHSIVCESSLICWHACRAYRHPWNLVNIMKFNIPEDTQVLRLTTEDVVRAVLLAETFMSDSAHLGTHMC